MSTSTSVARDLFHDLVGVLAISWPAMGLALSKAVGGIYIHHAV